MAETEEKLNIGEQLSNARLKQGKTLGDVSKDLCIRKIYLEAIEKLDYQKLAPIPYGVGFVRSYAEYLGLDAESAVKAYKLASNVEDTNKISIAEENEEDSAEENSKPHIRHMMLGLLGLVVIFALWQWAPTLNSDNVENEFSEANSESVIPEPIIIEDIEIEAPALTDMGVEDVSESNVAENGTEVVPEEQKTLKAETQKAEVKKAETQKAEPKKTETKEDSKKNIKENSKTKTETSDAIEGLTPTAIRMVLAGPSWVEIRKGDKILVEGTKNKGFTYDIPDEKGITVSVGRYYNVDFYVRGRLTKIASSMKQTNIKLDKYIEE